MIAPAADMAEMIEAAWNTGAREAEEVAALRTFCSTCPYEEGSLAFRWWLRGYQWRAAQLRKEKARA